MEKKRRNFLRFLGVGALFGASGCLENISSPTGGSSVVRPFPESVTLTDSHSVAMPSSVGGESVEGGEQVRIRRERTDDQTTDRPIRTGVFTRMESPPVDPDGDVLLTQEAMDALNLLEGDSVTAITPAPNPNINLQSSARRNTELMEQLVEDEDESSDYIAISPYGGDMEQNTGKQSLRVTSQNVTVDAWSLFGYDPSAADFHRWRIQAADIHPGSYPEMPLTEDNYSANEYLTCVSFEGTDDFGGVLVNGFAPRSFQRRVADKIKSELRSAGSQARVSVADAGSTRTVSPDHVANKITGSRRNGVAVYQADNVREIYWKEVADGVLAAIEEERSQGNPSFDTS